MGERRARVVLDEVWRASAASMLGVLARRLGSLDLAEEALHDAIGEALSSWHIAVPDSPEGWLVTTAWRRAVDRLRREAVGRDKLARLAAMPDPVPVDDDRLVMFFACADPSLPPEAQVALTMHAVAGFTAEELAAAFLVPVPTMAQRLVRAKKALRDAGVRFEPPDQREYGARLPAVLHCLYLIFNEGYLASSRRQPQRRELAREALDLSRQLAALMPAEPEPIGLVCLIELNEARAATRFDSWGRLVPMQDQDRSRWDWARIQSAVRLLRTAVERNRPGQFQLMAGIAAQHALVPSMADTNWYAIRDLYDRLIELAPTPLARLSRAVATRYLDGPATALAEIEPLRADLDANRLYHSTRAEFLTAAGDGAAARVENERALALATNPAERDLLARRLAN
jgi:RNA polymerase sigma-70 factor (ECF subfamily)